MNGISGTQMFFDLVSGGIVLVIVLFPQNFSSRSGHWSFISAYPGPFPHILRKRSLARRQRLDKVEGKCSLSSQTLARSASHCRKL